MHYDLWPAPNTGSGNVILPGITALNLEDFLLFGECGVGVVILLRNPINDMDSKNEQSQRLGTDQFNFQRLKDILSIPMEDSPG